MSSSNKKSFWFIFQNEKLLLTSTIQSHSPLSLDEIFNIQSALTRQYCLMDTSQYQVFCAELPTDFTMPDGLTIIPLKKALELLHSDWYNIAAKASAIIDWDKNHQYCGRCSNPTIHRENTFERYCPICNLVFYPRISPSIIVLIQKNDHILMARGHHFTPGVYGLIAGFVEPGESLEDAVHREVKEEINIKIKNLTYFGSQAWPFPDSLMMGFIAEYASGEIQIDPKEIAEAGWYRYDALPGRPSSQISIANRLLNDVIAKLSKSSPI
ncbi:MAG: hypothetical protein ACD_46C00695G0001 [uncultured bacterium]|nr:MAG: hypothetical protein ACD_46C00695G0001 [uncultured bacterium]